MSELKPKPCPLCGKKPIIETWSSGGLKYMCKCNNPDCAIPLGGYPIGRSPASVVEEWNKRAEAALKETEQK